MQIVEFCHIKDRFGSKSLNFVGGKNSSLGNMISDMEKLGVKVPDGFAITTSFYNEFIEFKSIKLKMDIKIDVPVLNLYGLKDRLVPPDASRALSGMVTERYLYNEASFDCGHIGMYTMGGEERTPGQVIGLWLGQELF